MKTTDLRAILEQVEPLLAEEELAERAEAALRLLLNAVERLNADIRWLADEVERLRNPLEQKKKLKTTGKSGGKDSRGKDSSGNEQQALAAVGERELSWFEMQTLLDGWFGQRNQPLRTAIEQAADARVLSSANGRADRADVGV